MSSSNNRQIKPNMLVSIFAYNSPVAGSYLLIMPIGIVLQGIYATHFGMTLAAIASVFFVARIFDAVSDPVIGHLADATRSAGISRKYWVVSGGLMLIICGYFLYVPSPNPSYSYFMFWSLAFYLAWTMFDVSHYAWGSELSREPKTRTKIFGIRGAMVYIGAIGFYVLPLLPIFDTTEFTPETLKFGVAIASLYIVPTLYIALKYVPDGEFIPAKKKQNAFELLKTTFCNKPFIPYVMVYILTGISGGIWLSLTFIVFDSYYGIGEKIAMMYFLGSAIGLCGLPFWLKLSQKIGKRNCWYLAQSINIVCFSIPLLIEPGPYAFIFLLISTIGVFFSDGCRQSVLPSLLADIIDYGTWKFGSDRAASYFALNTLMQKMSIGVGAGIGLMLFSQLGFDPATVTVGDPSVQFSVHVVFCIIPALIIVISMIFLTRMRLSTRHSTIIRRRLDGRINQKEDATGATT